MQSRGRCRGGFYRSLRFSILSFWPRHCSSVCIRVRASRKGWPPERTVEIQELGFVLACYYVVYEHGNVARQGRKSIHERTGQYLPVKRHCTRIFPMGRVLYARLIHFALEPRPIAVPLWHATNDYQRTTVFHLFLTCDFYFLPFHLLVFFLLFHHLLSIQ